MPVFNAIRAKIRSVISCTGIIIKALATDSDATSANISSGTGAPTAAEPDGSVYLRKDGAAATTFYVRAAGAWVAK